MKGIIAMILIPISEVVYEITCLTESNQFTDTIATHSVIMPLCSTRGLPNCAAGHLNSYVGERTIASAALEKRGFVEVVEYQSNWNFGARGA
jgi:hypothetical protein